MPKGSSIARCPLCGGWTAGRVCGLCGPFLPPSSTPGDNPVDPAEQAAHWGVLEAERTAYDERRRPSGAAHPAHWGTGAHDTAPRTP